MRIGFIGTGNMGGALIKGFLSANKCSVNVYDIDTKKASEFAELGAKVSTSIRKLADDCEIIILTVKPNIYHIILSQLSELGYSKKIISVAPGITTDYLKCQLPSAIFIRIMPNTPAMVGEGMTLIAKSDDADFQYLVQDLFNSVGKTAVLPESLLDAGTALSGSSPAIVYRCIDSLANSALSYGIPKKEALYIASQAVLGSAKMVLESGKHPYELADNVSSPGGTTIAALNELDAQGFDRAILKSMEKCVEKSKKMKK